MTMPWWRDGAMVCEADGDLDDDQHFVADAATEDDAQRFVDWHNDAIREVQRERDLAVAHDRQPYPTAAAYEAVCAALAQCKAASPEKTPIGKPQPSGCICRGPVRNDPAWHHPACPWRIRAELPA